jgi:ubiquinone biosynthesis protein UbiJ
MSLLSTIQTNFSSEFWQGWARKGLAPPTIAINYLLNQEPWAAQQLRPHAGKIACFDFHLFWLRIRITKQGHIEEAPGNITPNVTIHINLADIPLIIQNKERAISYVRLDGDADLAHVFSELAQNLRWDTEQQLSDWFGDIAGRRLANAGKAAVATLQTSAKKLQENFAEYFLEENPLLVREARVSEFAQEVGRTRDDVERLIKRIEKCEKGLNDF